jgi:hypothetical protein
MNRKQRATLERIVADRAPSDLAWRDIEGLFRALGATVSEGRGSRMLVELNHRRATFHRPHPSPLIDKGAIKAVRTFLENAGVRP